MIAFIILAIIVIVVLGAVLHLAKIAIILALAVGGFMLIRNKLGNKQIK